MIKINRIVIKCGSVYISKETQENGHFKSEKSQDLTDIYKKEGHYGLDHTILTLASKGDVRLIGSHQSIRDYKEILADPDNRKRYSEAKTDILLNTISTQEQPDGNAYVIKADNGYIAGCVNFKTADGYEVTPYLDTDVDGATPKYFVLKSQAQQYMDYIRRNCPQYKQFNMHVMPKKNTADFTGIQKIGNWCEKNKIELEFRQKQVTTGDNPETVKIYRFKANRDLKLIVHIKKPVTYELWRRNDLLLDTTNQLNIIEKLKTYKLK